MDAMASKIKEHKEEAAEVIIDARRLPLELQWKSAE